MVCLEIGYRVGRSSVDKHPESAHEGIGTIEAAVFGLLGLLLGFSFAGGTSRLDARRPVAAIRTVSFCALVVAGSNDTTTTLL